MGASTRGFEATVTFLSWATSTVVRCVWVVGLACRNVSSRLLAGEGTLCCTEIWLVMGEPGCGGPRPAAAGARRPPRPPPPRLARMRPLPCWRIGIHASAIVVVYIFWFENVLDVTGAVQGDKSVKAINACRRVKLNFLIVVC